MTRYGSLPIAAAEALRWKVKTRSGFTVDSSGPVVPGEEAFVVHREGDDVRLTIRSLTRAAPQQPWRTLYPALRIAQRIGRRRYLRALRWPASLEAGPLACSHAELPGHAEAVAEPCVAFGKGVLAGRHEDGALVR